MKEVSRVLLLLVVVIAAVFLNTSCTPNTPKGLGRVIDTRFALHGTWQCVTGTENIIYFFSDYTFAAAESVKDNFVYGKYNIIPGEYKSGDYKKIYLKTETASGIQIFEIQLSHDSRHITLVDLNGKTAVFEKVK